MEVQCKSHFDTEWPKNFPPCKTITQDSPATPDLLDSASCKAPTLSLNIGQMLNELGLKIRKMSAVELTETRSLLQLLEEKQKGMKSLIKDIEASLCEIFSGLSARIKSLERSNAQWFQSRVKAQQLFHEIALAYERGNYPAAYNFYEEATMIVAVPPPSLSLPLLDLSFIQTDLSKLSAEIRQKLGGTAVPEEVNDEIPTVFLLEETTPRRLCLYNVASDTSISVTISNLPILQYSDVVQVRNTIYFVGGFSNMMASCHTYSYPLLSKVPAVLRNGDMVSPKFNHTLVAVPSQCCFTIGGSRIGPHNALEDIADCELYDPKSDVWKEMPKLNEARRGVTACLYNGRYIYVFGGSSATRGDLDTVEVMDRLSRSSGWIKQTWSTATSLAWTPRRCSAAVQINDGSILPLCLLSLLLL